MTKRTLFVPAFRLRSKLTCKERALFGVDLHKLGFHVLFGQNGQVLINDLAPEEVVPVEVADDVLGFLRHLEEVLLLGDFRIFSVTL